MTPHSPQPRRCTACQRTFTCGSSYQTHQVGRRSQGARCRSDDEMRKIGMDQRADGAWMSKSKTRNKPKPPRIKPGHRRPFA